MLRMFPSQRSLKSAHVKSVRRYSEVVLGPLLEAVEVITGEGIRADVVMSGYPDWHKDAVKFYRHFMQFLNDIGHALSFGPPLFLRQLEGRVINEYWNTVLAHSCP